MEKIRLGMEMATRYSDPTFVIIVVCLGGVIFNTVGVLALAYKFGLLAIPAVFALEWILYNFVYMRPRRAPTSKYITFNDAKLERNYANYSIPMSTLYDAYIAGKLDFRGDVYDTLAKHRYEFINFKLTFTVVKWLCLQLFPNRQNSSMKDQKSTKKEIAEHYDRGNDFFNAFLGPSMVYTSGVFRGIKQSLEEAQVNKMDMICQKLGLKEDDKFLDIGCGWGTLVRHAASRFGCTSTGVTLSAEGAKWCNAKNEEEDLTDRANILYMDYRDIPTENKYDGIASIEMAEHVGLKNFQVYLGKVRTMLKDDASFLMQVAGLRQGSNWEDVAWGLFMGHYIFPGADASTPLNWYIRQVERAGFEVQSIETIGRHYSHTLLRWYRNWLSNRDEMSKTYEPSLVRLWNIFLAWSVVASGQGTATCYQILCHKNLNKFPRDMYLAEPVGPTCLSSTLGANTGVDAAAEGAEPYVH